VLRSYGATFVTCPLSKSGCFGDVIEREVFIVIVLGTVDPWSLRSFGGGGGSAYQDIDVGSYFVEGGGSSGYSCGQSLLCSSC
jgi:hypothetical protein